MDSSKQQQLTTSIEELTKINFNEIIVRYHSVNSQPGILLKNYYISDISLEELSIYLKKLMEVLKKSIKEIGAILPTATPQTNEYGQIDILVTMHNIVQYLQAEDINSVISQVRNAVFYCISFNIWNPTEKVQRSDVNIKQLNSKLQLVLEEIINKRTECEGELLQIQNRKIEFDKFLQQKKEELNEIDSSTITMRKQVAEMNSLVNEATALHQQILNDQKNSSERLESVKESAAKSEGVIQDFKNLLQEGKIQLENTIKSSTDTNSKFLLDLEFVESKKSFFEERINYLEELIGREVGASLFETFKQRKSELQIPIRTWSWIVICATFLVFLAILTIFTNFFGHMKYDNSLNGLEIIFINTLKTSPFFILLFYTINQYNKERTFQEEYAFKSAVALTIKAYADLLIKDDCKDELILSAVTNIYRNPSNFYHRKSKTKDEDKSVIALANNAIETAKAVIKKP